MVSPGFAPRRIRQLEDRIRERVVEILDHLKDADTCDFVTDITAELPVRGELLILVEISDSPHTLGAEQFRANRLLSV